jgi:hypothetical protein
MNNRSFESHMDVILALGAIWGMSEALLGMWLQRCASLYSGAIMTGLAFFYMSFSWTATRKLLSLVMLLLVVSLFKMFDALLLSSSLKSGSVLNPTFAFFSETLAFMAVVLLLRKSFDERLTSRLLTGAGAALGATLIFPMAGIFTGSPACLFPATQISQSIVTSPIAIIISLVTVPLGFVLAKKYTSVTRVEGISKAGLVIRYAWAPVVFIMCLALITITRLT